MSAITTHVYLEDILNYPITISMRNLRAFARQWARVAGKGDRSFDYASTLDFLHFLEQETMLCFLSEYQTAYARLVPRPQTQHPSRAHAMQLLANYIHPSFRPSVVMWKYCTKEEGKVVYETSFYGTMMHGQYLEQQITSPRIEQLQRTDVPYTRLVKWINRLQPSDFNLTNNQPFECMHHLNVDYVLRTEVVTLVAGDVTIRFVHTPETGELQCSVIHNQQEAQLETVFNVLEDLSLDRNMWTASQ